jgi:release factor glutamine methyltransferase
MQIRSARLGELYALMKEELEDVYPEQELQNLIYILISHLSGYSRSEIILRKDEELSESKIHFLQLAVKRLKKHEPVHYITGLAHFHGYEFKVDPSVLIPRPETEELVQWVLDEHQEREKLRILDVGTGSGCIAITLKKKIPGSDITALDVSDQALEVARFNAKKLGAEIDFQYIDIISVESRSTLPNFDIIVSNPPYVTPEDKEKMLPNVTDFEPALALYVEDDPLLFYREIIRFCETHLRYCGHLYFESNEAYADQVAELLKNAGFHKVEIQKDIQGKKRMIKAIKPAVLSE